MSNGYPFGAGGPGAAAAQPATGFVLVIPADPAWEPFETTDTLDQDGYYMVKIIGEKGRTDAGKKAGLFLTLEVQDADAIGKRVSKFMPDPTKTESNVWFLWRGLILSITGDINRAKGGLTYNSGMLTGQTAYVRTGAYSDDGATRTGVDAWVTKTEYDEARTHGGAKFRWAPKARAASGPSVGSLPAGLPPAFVPGSMPGGLPGAPVIQGVAAPQPTGAPPVVGGAPPPAPGANPFGQSFAPPPAAAPAPAAFAPAPGTNPFAPPPAAAPAQAGFTPAGGGNPFAPT